MDAQHPLQSESPMLAERALIGVLLARPDLLSEVRPIITESDFLEDMHRIFFRAMKSLADQGRSVDLVTVGESVDK